SHGVYRPGGSALNSGQVGGFRAAAYIANRYRDWAVSQGAVHRAAMDAVTGLQSWIARCEGATRTWQADREAFQARMTRAGAHVRSRDELAGAIEEAWAQWTRLETSGCVYEGVLGLVEALRNRQLCFAHAVYLEAIAFALQSGVGSRGSAIVLDPEGRRIHEGLGGEWRIAPEDETFRDQVLETVADLCGPAVRSEWVRRRPIPDREAWFETAWAQYQSGEVYALPV
ncbi:MAG: hypothetical protein JXA89_09225, partial [Anaerolineae bacterium]|nr:hypothetical protein [Anaerolineae bacterium]